MLENSMYGMNFLNDELSVRYDLNLKVLTFLRPVSMFKVWNKSFQGISSFSVYSNCCDENKMWKESRENTGNSSRENNVTSTSSNYLKFIQNEKPFWKVTISCLMDKFLHWSLTPDFRVMEPRLIPVCGSPGTGPQQATVKEWIIY